jgi:hypothetical protein
MNSKPFREKIYLYRKYIMGLFNRRLSIATTMLYF